MRKTMVTCDGCGKEFNINDKVFWMQLELKTDMGRPLLTDNQTYLHSRLYRDLCQDCIHKLLTLVGVQENYFEEIKDVLPEKITIK